MTVNPKELAVGMDPKKGLILVLPFFQRGFAFYAVIAFFYPLIHLKIIDDITFQDLFFEIYTGLVLLLAAIVFARFATSVGAEEPSRKWYYLATFTIFAFAVLLRSLDLHSLPLWGDEMYQGTGSRFFPLVKGAGSQHQPPLDYAFTGLALDAIGVTETALRIHAVVFSALGATLFFWIALAISPSFWLAGILWILFFFHASIFHYGTDGRPISLGIFASLLILGQVLVLIGSIRSDNELQRNDYLRLVATAMLALLSLGLQPPFLCLAIASVLLIFSMLWAKKRGVYLRLSAALISPLLMFLPLQIYIGLISPPKFRANLAGAAEPITRITEGMAYALKRLLPGQIYLFFLGILVSAILFRRQLNNQVDTAKISDSAFNYYFITAVTALFFILEISFFKICVNSYFMFYYALLLVPLYLLSCAALYNSVQVAFPTFLRGLVAPIFAVALAWSLSQYPLLLGDKKTLVHSYRLDLRGPSEYLRQNASPDDFTYFFCTTSGEAYCRANSPFVSYYNAGPNIEKLTTNYGGVNFPQEYMDTLSAKIEPRKLFLVYIWGDVPIEIPTRTICEKLRCKAIFFNGVTLFELENPSLKFTELTKSFFEIILDAVPQAKKSEFVIAPYVFALQSMGQSAKAISLITEFQQEPIGTTSLSTKNRFNEVLNKSGMKE
jgi:hypothetical protein